MRPCLFAVLALMVACTPDIGPGTYFCGSERLCPPDLSCDDTSYTCIVPSSVRPFVCPEGFEDFEPDSVELSARDLGELECGRPQLQNGASCLVSGDAADYYTFAYNGNCQGENPHLEIRLRYPIAHVPLRVELLDGNSNVIATGEICTSSINTTGRERVCIDIPPVTGTIYFVKVSREPDGPDCNGDCDFNQYLLDIQFPLAGS